MAKFRKKPVVIEAVRYTGENSGEVKKFCPQIVRLPYKRGVGVLLEIETLEGDMQVSIGDWVIKGVKGEFYPCKPDIFEATYEPVND